MEAIVSRVLTADDYTRGPSGPASSSTSIIYRISADAQPGALFRIAGILNYANRAPSNLSMRSTGLGQVLIETALRDIPATLADMLRRKLVQLTCVITVEMGVYINEVVIGN